MFANAVNSAATAAKPHPRAKPQNQVDTTELAIRSQARSRRDASWFVLTGAHQLEDCKGKSSERQKRNQKKYDFVTAFHSQR
jgi:hypothetical protein